MSAFAQALDAKAAEIHGYAVAKGFWPGGERNFGECIALIHSELSELLEAHRSNQGHLPDEKCPHFTRLEIEAADIAIRLMDLAAGYGWRLGDAIESKQAANEHRSHKHGKAY